MILESKIAKLRKFGKTDQYIIDNLTDALCGQVLRRGFNQDFAEFLKNNPAEAQYRKDLIETIDHLKSLT